jgi:hypothetical protein
VDFECPRSCEEEHACKSYSSHIMRGGLRCCGKLGAHQETGLPRHPDLSPEPSQQVWPAMGSGGCNGPTPSNMLLPGKGWIGIDSGKDGHSAGDAG